MPHLAQVLSRLLGVLLCLAFSSIASIASAHDEEWSDRYYPYGRQGIYIGLGGLFALENFDRGAAIEGENSNLEIGADDAGGFELRGGYRLHSNFATELLFQYYAGFSVSDRSSGENDTFNGWSLTANAKAYPLLGQVQPYVVAGVGMLDFTEKQGDDFGFVSRVGGGVDIYLSESLVVDFEVTYQLPAAALDDYQFATFSLGFQYRY